MKNLREVAIAIAAATLVAGCRARPASIDVGVARVTIYGIGESKDVSARVLDKKGNIVPGAVVKWTSANPAVANINDTGHVIAKSAGSTKLTAASANLSASVSVEIKDLARIEARPAVVNLVGPAGSAMRIEVEAFTRAGGPTAAPRAEFTSKNPKVATVDAGGTVRSVANGSTSIMVKIGEILGESDVTVSLHEISRLEIRPETAILKIGETQKFEVIAYDGRGVPIPSAAAQFSTPAPGVIRLAGDGTVTALQKGTGLVVATIAGATANATVLVN